MKSIRIAAVGIALVASNALSGSALATAHSAHSETHPPKPKSGPWSTYDSQYLTFSMKLKKSGNHLEMTDVGGRFKPTSTALYCQTTGAYTIKGNLPVRLIKASKHQSFWGYAKRFHADSAKGLPVTLKFKNTTVKAKLSVTFDTHEKAKDGDYVFGDGGNLFVRGDDECGSVFSMKHH
jgi:hypothetical protein